MSTPSPSSCLDENTLFEFSQGQATPEERERVEAHLAGCARCFALVADVLRAQETQGLDPLEADAVVPLQAGSRLDRFIVLERVGAGAMGQVFVAHDPKLDRKVALKLVKPGAELRAGAGKLRARMLREAQSLARLSHPHLVAIFDVLERGDGLVLAMEYVPGASVREWLRAAPRPWPEVVGVFLAAGRGLAAVHEAGLVHRDVKPDNVIVSRQGEVKLADFGLATLLGDGPTLPAAGADALAVELTQPGELLGTPAYMAPELFDGQPGTPQSDQYAFCASLYEALYGERPFDSSSLAKLREQARTRQVRPAPAGSAVPPWLRALLLRGLSPAPAERFPSLVGLLAELGRDRPRERRRRWALGVGAVVLVAVVATLARPPPGPCRDPRWEQGLGWGEAERAQVHAAFVATGAPGAEQAAVEVDQRAGRLRR